MIPVSVGMRSSQTNHGPVCRFECPQCHEKGPFNLISEKIAVTFWFIPFGNTDGAWSLKCPACGAEIVLGERDAGQALAMNRHLATLSPEELGETKLEDLLEEYPIEGLQTLLRSNTHWTCPKCKSDVPETMTSCWNCQYYP